jgi:lipoprotein-anchoring transpeptidase ErfK/SrfK
MANVQIEVILPDNRDKKGVMVVSKENKKIAKFEVLGRGSRGPGNTQFLEKGNTPSGVYSGNEIVSTEDWSQTSYGPNGAIRLKPISGNAFLTGAHRKGLLIHGGELASKGNWKGSLKPTHGCLRLKNEDMILLINIVKNASMGENSCSIADITVHVFE